METEQLLEIYRSARQEFEELSLKRADLSGTSLPGISLIRCKVTQSNLQDIDLSKSDLYKTECKLEGASLSPNRLYSRTPRAVHQ